MPVELLLGKKPGEKEVVEEEEEEEEEESSAEDEDTTDAVKVKYSYTFNHDL